MAKFIIFLFTVFLLSVIGLAIWWVWSRVYVAIKRRESVFDIEEETHKKIKKKIREEKE
ncbi:hypothetical protein [Hungatella hathewayi]|uniref:hypothetical protein n=1 Tax=Hungatella hathewayi TaxID=154046 RepID=UPI0015F314D7|nr:hypothetical protein [Hungatella hathewayi]